MASEDEFYECWEHAVVESDGFSPTQVRTWRWILLTVHLTENRENQTLEEAQLILIEKNVLQTRSGSLIEFYVRILRYRSLRGHLEYSLQLRTHEEIYA